MATYVITGASRGIGFEYLRQLSAKNPDNIVVGLVRDKAGVEKKVAAELNSPANVHILQGDITDRASLKKAAEAAAKIVGDRGVDYLIANAAFTSEWDQFDNIGTLADKTDELEPWLDNVWKTNVLSNVYFINIFIHLVLKSKVKKVIVTSSGHADLDLINDYDIEIAPFYAASKAALNVLTAKFSAQYKKDGVLFVSFSPGVVDTNHFSELTPEQIAGIQGFMTSMAKYAPDFKGPIKVDDAVRMHLEVFEKISIKDGFAGQFISHFGNKQWV